jgi:hypothetical protein
MGCRPRGALVHPTTHAARAPRAARYPVPARAVRPGGRRVGAFYRLGRQVVTCDPVLGARGGVQIIDRGACIQVVGWPVGIYWIIAFVLAYVAVAAFYLYRARSRGVGARVLPYVGAGIAAGLVFGIASAGRQQLNMERYFLTGPVAVGMVPLISIGLALLVLARVERNWPLLAFATGYLVVAALACGMSMRRLGPTVGSNLGPMWRCVPLPKAEHRAERVALRWGKPVEPIQERSAQLVEPGERELHLRLDAGRPGDATPRSRSRHVVQKRRLADAGVASK